MVSTNVAPGVYTTETDMLSTYVARVPTSIGFIPIICEKGRDNQLIATNSVDFFTEFGEPDISYGTVNGVIFSYGHYVASSFLSVSDSLYVIRCTPEDAAFAYLMFEDSTSTYTSTGITSTTVSSIETAVDTSEHNSFIFYGLGRGNYYNNFKVNISKSAANTDTYDPDLFIVDIYRKLKESFIEPTYDESSSTVSAVTQEYTKVESFEVSFKPNRMDYSGNSMWIEDVINNNSGFLRCYVNSNFDYDVDFTEEFQAAILTDSPIALESGSDGDTSTYTEILVDAYKGELKKNTDGESHVDEVLNSDYYFSMVFDGGYPVDVKYAIESLVSIRKDCLGIVDLGPHNNALAAIDTKINDLKFNNKYIAVYEPYTKVFDNYTGKHIWVPPSYHMAKFFPALPNEWTGPAGFEHGLVTGVRDIKYNPTPSQRAEFYLNQINPIVRFNEGYAVYSQLTTQARTAAFQDVNIMRVYLYIKRALEEFCRWYVFQLNNAETWTSIKQKIDAFLEQVRSGGGLYSFTTSVGADSYQIKAKEIHVDVTLEPTRLAEKIYLNFSII